MFDVIVVGGGPAGLSAALMLGRCRRRVLVVDDGHPRNAVATHSQGFFTRDGAAPAELLRLGREQLRPYDVELRDDRVVDARRDRRTYEVTLASGARLACRRLVLATGVSDTLPPIENIEPFYGRSVHHCPYCDGWEHRDQPIATYGRGITGVGLALSLTIWSHDVLLLTDRSRVSAAAQQQLKRAGISWRTDKVLRAEGSDGQLERLVLASGETIPRQALFFHTGTTQRSDLAIRLGCNLTHRGAVKTGKLQETCVPGLYVIGDTARDVQFIIVAAAEGAKAALAINKSLREEVLPTPEE